MEVWEKGGDFPATVAQDAVIGRHLSQGELGELFDLKHHLRRVKELFRRVFEE
jgi:adenylosuccinate lyase